MKTLAKILLLLAFLIPNVVLADEPIKLYSCLTGSWTNPACWTLEPSGKKFENPDHLIPNENTEVVIIAGATITLPDKKDGIDFIMQCKSLTVNGELVLNNHLGHTVNGIIEGNGQIIMPTDNYPSFAEDGNKFITDGGTTVFQSSSDDIIVINTTRTYSNLCINKANVKFAASIDCNGSLTVANGGKLILSAQQPSVLNIAGNINVNNSCDFSVDDNSQPFDIYIHGDITNDGTLKFTNLTEYSETELNTGYANVHFVSGTHDQTVNCNNVVNFYKIFMNKGTSDSYTLLLTAYNKENFNLYGPAQTMGNDNLILQNGTLEIGSNIIFPFLNKQTFSIPSTVTMLVDAGKVNTDNVVHPSFIVEGKLKVQYNGEVHAYDNNNVNAISLVKKGILEVAGGNVYTESIKNGTVKGDASANNEDLGSYYQTGGNVVVDNRNSGDKHSFSLRNVNSGFLMKGGVLHIKHGGIKILSSSASHTVDGGKVVLSASSSYSDAVQNEVIITSNAPFPSLYIENETAMKVSPEPRYDLKVNGDLYIGENCTLEYNGQESVYIWGNLTAKGTYVCDNNTTYFNGETPTEISLPEDFKFNKLIFAKTKSDVAITTKTSFTVTKDLVITGGEFTNGDYNITVGGGIDISNGNIRSNSGYIYLVDNAISQDHYLTSPLHNPAMFGNISYSGNKDLQIYGPVITKDFKFEDNSKLVVLNGNYVEVCGNLWNSSPVHFFRNNDEASGGLKRHVSFKKNDEITEIVYHISSNEHHTPATIVVDGTKLDKDYSGTLMLNTVGKKHPNLKSEGNNMGRYWIVTQSGLDEVPGNAITYTFENNNNIPNDLVPEGLVPFKGWKISDITSYSGNTFTYTNAAEGFFSGDFTCATPGDFVMNVYRTNPSLSLTKKVKEDWTKASTWRKITEDGSLIQDGWPGNNDIAYIYINRVNVTSDITVGQIVFVDEDSEGGTYGYSENDDLEHQPRVQLTKIGVQLNVGRISGEGVVNQAINKDNKALLNLGDKSDFVSQENSWIMYNIFSDIKNFKTYDKIPNFALECNGGSALTYSFDGDFTIDNDLNLRGNVKLEFPNTEKGNLYIGKNVYVGDWLGAKIRFNSERYAHTMTVGGNIIMTNNGCNPQSDYDNLTDDKKHNYRSIEINSYNFNPQGKIEHRLKVGGNIYLGVHTIDLFKKKDDNNYVGVILEVNGSQDASIIKRDEYKEVDGEALLNLWKIVMNKEQGKKFTIDRDFVLASADPANDYANQTIKPITMTSGHLIINNPNKNRTYKLSSDGNFVLNAEAVLETKGAANYTINNSGISLSGTLILDDGSKWNVDNSIEYTESATCELRIVNGTMTVGEQIRPPLSAGGSLKLKLESSNAELNIGAKEMANNDHGRLELVNMSWLNMAAGSKINIKGCIPDNSVPDIYIKPVRCHIDPSATINVESGDMGTTTIYSNVDIPNVSVSNQSKLKMMSGDLTITGLLNIGELCDFSTDVYKLYLKGGMNCQGNYDNGTSTTYICGEGTQTITGNLSFYNLVKNTESTADFDGKVIIKNQADFLSGIFKGKSITAKGNVNNNAVYECPNFTEKDHGFIFGGGEWQILKSNGNGTFEKIILDNSTGVQLPTGNSFTVTQQFQLNKGNFDLGTCTITMDKDAIFTTLNDETSYSVSNMIRVTDAYATGGIRKIFNEITSQEYFMIPIGTTGKYSPVTIETHSINDGASITVRPVNEMSNCSASGFYGYYWNWLAENVNTFSGYLSFKFSEKENIESPFVGVFQCDNDNTFTKFEHAWDPSKKQLTFGFQNSNDQDLTGRFLGSNNGDIDGSVPEYKIMGKTDNENGFALWNDKNIWYDYKTGDPINAVPTNAVVHIFGKVSMEQVESIAQCKTYIEKDAILDQVLSQHNDLGTVLGTGTLKSKSGDLPAGVYDAFNSKGGGTLHFYGGGRGIETVEGNGYSILKQMPVVNNLVIEGSEVKDFPNMDIQILGDFTIKGDISNSTNHVISLKGNLNYEKGNFITGNLGESKFVFNGDDDWQTVSGCDFSSKNCIYNLVVNNPYGVKFENNVFVSKEIFFEQGLINTQAPKGMLTLDNAAKNSVHGYGDDKFVDGPFCKRINNGEQYTFPIGNVNNEGQSRYGELTIQNTSTEGTAFWTVEYVYSVHPKWAYLGPGLVSISPNEYWKIFASQPTDKAQIVTRWDDHSQILPETLELENVRQVRFFDEGDNNIEWRISGTNPIENESGVGGYIASDEIIKITNDASKPDCFTFGFATEHNYSWIGETSSDWYNPENWFYKHIPNESVKVKIGGNPKFWPTVPQDAKHDFAECKSLTICDGGNLEILSRGHLTVHEDITVEDGGKLTLKAPTAATDKDAYGYHSVPPSGSLIYGGDFSGDVIFERYVRNCVFERMAIPVTGFDKKLIVHPAYDIYYANEAFNLDKDPVNYTYSGNEGDQSLKDNPHILRAGWKLFNNPNVNCIDSAYLLCSYEGRARAFSFKGKPLANESAGHIIPVNFTLNDMVTISDKDEDIYSLDGWNFIPNPFLSAVDIDKMEFENVDATVYVHDNVSDKSFCYQKNASEQAGFIPINGNYNPQYIAGGQSFFVHAKKAAAGYNGRVIFPNECLTHGDENTLIKSTTSGDNSVDKIVFNTSGKGGNFQSVVYFRNNATTGFDSDYDAYLQETMDAGVLNFYSVGSNYFEPLMINGLPQSIKQGGEIKLGYSTSTAGVYTLTLKKFTVNDVIVYLEDTQEGTSTPLSAGFTCQINVDKGTNNKRFKLVFRTNNAPLAKAQINDFTTEAGKDFEYAVGKDLFVDNDLGDYVADVTVTAKDGALLPSWLQFDYNNGKFVGSPAAEDAGRYNIQIVATDSRGAKSAPLSFAIVVTEPQPVAPDPVTPPSGPVIITITRPTEDPVNNTDNPEVSNPDVVTPNPDNIVTVEDPVIPIYVDPESPVTVEQLYPEVVDIEPVLPEVVDINPVENVIPSDINPVLPDIIPEITPDPIEIQEPIVDDNAEMPLPDPVQFVDNDDVFVTPFGDGNIEIDEDIKIYPVPSDGRVTVDFGSLIHETGSVQMTLITGSGRILTRKTVYDDSIYLDLTGRTGIYLIRLATPSKTITKRIIIQ